MPSASVMSRSGSRWMLGRCAVVLTVLTCGLTGLGDSARVRADEVSSALYVRTDTDQTTVISPRARGSKNLGDSTRVDVTYAADVWTSASIDIRASASVRPVTEQRDELDLSLGQELEDLHLRASYRFSTEHDYTSHGVTLGAALDLASNASTLDASLHVIGDTVGQAGNPSFSRSLTTIDGSFSFTQVLDPQMWMQLTYELAHNDGYQSSPYRWVGVGGTGFGCVGAHLCLPERVPSVRTRHAMALVVRRALSNSISAGLTYRYYFDDWSLSSHTLLGELGWNIGEHSLLALRYRFYTQGAAEFYQRTYLSLATDQYRTRDRELSKLVYQRAGAELEHEFLLSEQGAKLAGTLAIGGNFYSYADFVGLSQVTALEVSLGLMLQI